DYVTLVPLGRPPAAALRRTVGKMPAQQESELRLGSWRDVALDGERADRVVRRSVGTKLPIAREVVPERLRSHGPTPAAVPSGQIADTGVCCVERCNGERSGQRFGFCKKRVLHKKTLRGTRLAELIRAAFAADRIVDGECNGDRQRLGREIRYTISKDGDR